MSRIPSFLVAFMLGMVANPLLAEEAKKADTPESVAQNSLQAIKEDRLDDYVKSMHPEALKRFKDLVLPTVETATKDGLEKQALYLFNGVRTLDELKKLDDAQIFVSFYRGVTKLRPMLKDTLSTAEIETVGHVSEGKETAHVVCRVTVTADGAKVSKMEVVTLQQSPGGWKIMLGGDMEGLTYLLKRRLTQN